MRTKRTITITAFISAIAIFGAVGSVTPTYGQPKTTPRANEIATAPKETPKMRLKPRDLAIVGHKKEKPTVSFPIKLTVAPLGHGVGLSSKGTNPKSDQYVIPHGRVFVVKSLRIRFKAVSSGLAAFGVLGSGPRAGRPKAEVTLSLVENYRTENEKTVSTLWRRTVKANSNGWMEVDQDFTGRGEIKVGARKGTLNLSVPPVWEGYSASGSLVGYETDALEAPMGSKSRKQARRKRHR
jgi:hypothetical protein